MSAVTFGPRRRRAPSLPAFAGGARPRPGARHLHLHLHLDLRLGPVAVTLRALRKTTHAVRPLDGSQGRVAGLTGLLDVSTGGRVPRKPALVANAPEALAVTHRIGTSRPIVPPPARIATLARATVIAGVVVDAGASVIAESLINTKAGVGFGPFVAGAAGGVQRGGPRVAVARRLRGRPYVLLKQRFDANYAHWLVEGLPRLAGVAERFDLSRCGFIVSGWHGERMAAVYRDSLALFGIKPDQIVEAGDEPLLVDELIYPTPLSEHPWVFAPRCADVLAALAPRVPLALPARERLYVSRKGVGKRHLINEAEIEAILAARGFAVVRPETMTLREQIAAFRSARIVVGNYGAGLVNAAFATGEVTLFALTSAYMQDDFFPSVMSLRPGRYASLHGAASQPDKGMDSDFAIDPAVFERMLDGLLSTG